MSSYIPDYLAYNDRQYDGWPVGIDEVAKEWAKQQVRSLFEAEQRPLDLETVRRHLFNHDDRPAPFRETALFAQQYAVADRALRAANARPVWMMGE